MAFRPTIRLREIINDAWNKLVHYLAPGLEGMDLYGLLQTETTEGLTVFCDPTGSDSNYGTADAPFRQPQAAFNSLPKNLRHPVKIKLAPGTYAGCVVSGTNVLPSATSTTDTSYFHIEGTMSDVTAADLTPATGTLTAWTAQSNQVFPVATDSTKNFTVNEFEGKYLQITSGTGSVPTLNTPNMWLITSNTATTITCTGPGVTNPTAGSGYKIVSPGTFFTSAVTPSSGINNPASTAQFFGPTGVVFTQNFGVSFTVSNCEFTLGPSLTRGITTGEQRVRAMCCRFNGGTGALNAMASNASTGLNGGVLMFECYSVMPTTNVHYSYSTGGGSVSLCAPALTGCYLKSGLIGCSFGGMAAGPAINGTLFKGMTNSGVTMNAMAQGQFVNSRFDGTTIGINSAEATSSGMGMASIGLAGVDISNCTTGIALSAAYSSVVLNNVTGTLNTTGLNISRGARAAIASNVTLTGSTNEILIDGVQSTLAAMRAATPKLIQDPNYGTCFYQ